VECSRRVEAWIRGQQRSGDENVLTLEIIPTALREQRLPAAAGGGQPAFYEHDTGIVWFSEGLLSDWWLQRRYLDERTRQLGSQDSLRLQRKALGITGKGTSVTISDTSFEGKRRRRTARYHALPLEVSARVLERSGMSDGDLDEA
jgi:hypothetical protein